VAAGLVVGNPIGSGGTRGKALTAAELKAIVEASGIGYLPLSGGTLTGSLSLGSNALTCGAVTSSNDMVLSKDAGGYYTGRIYSTAAKTSSNVYIDSFGQYAFLIGTTGKFAGDTNGVHVPNGSYFGYSNGNTFGTVDVRQYRGGAGVLAQRNALNAQCFLLSKTYTSDSSQEALMLDAGKQISGKLGLYSYRGSSGGTNYPIQIGMLAADGATFSGMTVATDGGVAAAKIGAGGSAYASYPLTVNGSAIFRDSTGSSFVCLHGKSGTWLGNSDDNYAFASYKPSIYFFTNGEYASTASAAIALHATSVTLGKALVPKTLADSAAPNGSIYYSSDAAKLVFKDAGGTVNNLY